MNQIPVRVSPFAIPVRGSAVGPNRNLAPAWRAEIRSAGIAGQSLWTEFWQEFCLENQPHERCHVPGDGQISVDRHWAEFADGLAARANVIDLGCGAGIVGRALLRRRFDLRVTGVDWANVPIVEVPNLEIHRWVRMEDLPFGDGGFDAAVSLFGIEYGEIAKTARELRRVLIPGARFSFLIHHRESEILREGVSRRAALRGLFSGKMKAAFLAGNVANVEQERHNLGMQFPGDPSIELFGDYFYLQSTRTRAERHTLWQDLSDGLAPEIALLAQLDRAAKSADEVALWLAPLLSAMESVGASAVRRPSGEPIAWHVGGVR